MQDLEANRQQPPKANTDTTDLLGKIPTTLTVLLGSTYCLIFLCIILVIPILELAIGAAYRNQCPINSNIPVYLIVAGVCGISTIFLALVIVAGFIFCIKRNSMAATFAIGCIIILIIIFISFMSFFLFIWFIVGNVWIFGAKKNVQHNNPTLDTYCERTLYEFAFAILIITYVVMVVSCCVRCCRGVLGALKSAKQ